MEEDSLTKEEEIGIRIEFLHRYNDAFREFEGYHIEATDYDLMKRGEEDLKLLKSNLTALINLLDATDDNDIILLAELYRESSDFEKSIAILNSYRPKDDYLQIFVRNIIKKAEEKNDKIFLIEDE